MASSFKFPSLKAIAMVKIVEYIINAKIISIGELSINSLKIWNVLEINEFVQKLQLPFPLKKELKLAITGICCNISHWKNGLSGNREITDYVLDSHGQLNETLTWKKYFDATLSRNDCDLLALLRKAMNKTLLPEVYKVLKKILYLANCEVLLEDPQHHIDNFRTHCLTYKFKNPLDDTGVSKIISYLKLPNERRDISVDNNGFLIIVNSSHLNFDLFKEHLNLLRSTVLKERYAKSTIETLALKHHHTSLMKVLKFLEEETQLSVPLQECLNCFLFWPYVDNFIPMLKMGIRQNILPTKYQILFYYLVDIVRKYERCGPFYADLMLKFWHELPDETKIMIKDSWITPNNYIGRLLRCDMRAISREIPALHKSLAEI